MVKGVQFPSIGLMLSCPITICFRDLKATSMSNSHYVYTYVLTKNGTLGELWNLRNKRWGLHRIFTSKLGLLMVQSLSQIVILLGEGDGADRVKQRKVLFPES
jgi:hypothetical protein